MRGTALGAGGVAAAALVGCGGGDEEAPVATAPAAATTAAPAASTAAATATAGGEQVKLGGKFQYFGGGDPPTIDPFGNLSFQTKGFAVFHYSRLFMRDTKPWPFPGASTGVKGDVAESAETEDGLTWVVKLKPGISYPNVAPVSGRAISTEDVAYSWSKLTSAAAAGADFVKFVDRMEVVDDSTLRFTLKEVFPFFLETLGDPSILYIVPTEADGQFDVNQTSIGSGPFILDEYRPGEVIRRSRNPGWHVKDEDGGQLPRVDQWEEAIIPEYQAQLAQFETGQIAWFTPGADDLLGVKERHPDLWFAESKGAGVGFFIFSKISTTDKPWADERVRQAVSMAIDRPGLNELQYNIKALVGAGLDAGITDWTNIVPANRKPLWLDPNSPDHGESGKFFQFNLGETQKLLAAAGHEGFEFTYHYTPRYGSAFVGQAEATHAMFVAAGMKPQTQTEDYNAVYITQTFQGNFDGIAFALQTGFNEIGSYFTRYFTDNPLNNARVDDAQLKELTAKQAVEFNEEARQEIIHEIQRVNMQHAYYVPHAYGAGATFTAFLPFVRGFRANKTGVYGAGSETAPYFWLDT
ncbi:MAG: ABC transporter substrate-binding protein [Dehalococcoidia bacterium]